MKLFFIKRRILAAAAAVAAVAAMAAVVNFPSAVMTSAATRQLPIYCVERDQKMVSISFDAAWGNEDTQQLIDILDCYGVKATFFVVGDWVEKYPESVLALHEAGHITPIPTPISTVSPPRRSPPTWRPATTRSRRLPACVPP